MSEKYYIEPDSKTRNNYLLPNFTNKMKQVMPPVYDRFTKEELEEIITDNYGIVTIICGLVDCTYKQLYNALDYYNLRGKLMEAKQAMVGLAEETIIQCLNSDRETTKLKAAEITLKSLGQNFGWSGDKTIINQQINVGDKETEVRNIFGV